ncbi:DUF2867 domain-containing protein [Planomonospora parontospora]|uniref:DUF2867 domain-containing protein n=1 Tax=Planomonospora parontospora TaxID=58119 RepID=UPI001670112F|nr:DUF2867 domain-containing protein [Planomonospora parontospora]GGL51159.1 hypothetical protein GCM10014719_60570 [Planomonospora parontospora subsp. antibiotica]GII19074.1 hypothetical protein Ppa05_58000 [Planomonospora parontospora subsp. antibiotica]
MRLPKSAHTSLPWRIHELTRDFSVEDVWSFRTPGAGPGDFPAMLAAMRAAMRATGGPARLRMAVLVKPNGRFGRLYMAAIAPFRYLVVYPALTRQWERAWRAHLERTSR